MKLTLNNQTKEEFLLTEENKAKTNARRQQNMIEACNAYKSYTTVSVKERFNETQLNRVSAEYAVSVNELKEALLREENVPTQNADDASEEEIAKNIGKAEPDVSADQAAQAAEIAKEVADNLDSTEDIVYVEGEIELAMNKSYDFAKRGKEIYKKTGKYLKQFFRNILIVGSYGTGKTERIKAWCRKHNVRRVAFKGSQLVIDDIKGIPTGQEDTERKGVTKTLSYGTFEIFNGKGPGDYCILHLDEFNRDNVSQRDAWFKFIDEHIMYDPQNRETGDKLYPNVLFTVVTINPYIIDKDPNATNDEEGVTPLGGAELDRFAGGSIYVTTDKAKDYQLKYYTKIFTDLAKKDPEHAENYAKTIAIARKLLKDKTFSFSNEKEIAKCVKKQTKYLSPRSLEGVLLGCDGDVKEFLKDIEDNFDDTIFQMIQPILGNFKDIDDETNKVWAEFNKAGILTLEQIKAKEQSDKEADEEDVSAYEQSTNNPLNKMRDLSQGKK